MIKLFKILIILFIINIITYFLCSKNAIDRIVENKYYEFTELRFQNPMNIDTSEYIFLSACNDYDFSTLRNTLSNSNGQPNYVQNVNYNSDIFNTLIQYTDTNHSNNVIIYKVCPVFEIPSMIEKIEYHYIFNSEPSNYHVMYYNGNTIKGDVIYLWLFGYWLEVFNQFSSYEPD